MKHAVIAVHSEAGHTWPGEQQAAAAAVLVDSEGRAPRVRSFARMIDAASAAQGAEVQPVVISEAYTWALNATARAAARNGWTAGGDLVIWVPSDLWVDRWCAGHPHTREKARAWADSARDMSNHLGISVTFLSPDLRSPYWAQASSLARKHFQWWAGKS